jgi:hypothetical protein
MPHDPLRDIPKIFGGPVFDHMPSLDDIVVKSDELRLTVEEMLALCRCYYPSCSGGDLTAALHRQERQVQRQAEITQQWVDTECKRIIRSMKQSGD